METLFKILIMTPIVASLIFGFLLGLVQILLYFGISITILSTPIYFILTPLRRYLKKHFKITIKEKEKK